MGKVREATDATFDAVVREAGGPVLVEFWAPWCVPCRSLAPTLEAIAREYPQLRVVKVNTDENPATGARYDVRAVPTMLVFKGGNLVKVITGAKPKTALVRDLAFWLF